MKVKIYELNGTQSIQDFPAYNDLVAYLIVRTPAECVIYIDFDPHRNDDLDYDLEAGVERK